LNYNYLVIEGNIGAGKTSLAKKIADDYQAHLILEQFADNPFLPKFYKNPEKYSFHVELSFLATRFEQLKNEIPNKNLFKSFTLADFYFIKSLIFAKVTLSESEFNLYRQIFNIIYKTLPKPDLFIYLHQNVDRLMENIQKRGRSYEQDIQKDYLKKLQDEYFHFLKQQQNMKILLLDVSNLDFINKSIDYKKITDSIFNHKYKPGINRIIF
jgi:deoxyadenosine/deoxycytidine kinase